MIPAKSRIHRSHVLVDEKGKQVRAVAIAALYGANASGKSNLIKAMDLARWMIVTGTRAGDRIPVVPFKLDESEVDRPSTFEFVIKHKGVVYTYGFSSTPEQVIEEWLFAWYSTREARLFERITRDGKAHVETGTRLARSGKQRDVIDLIASTTRPNQLFLREAIERNVRELEDLHDWFKNHLRILSPDHQYGALPLMTEADVDFSEFLSDFLRLADSGIDGIETSRRAFDDQNDLLGLPENARREIVEKLRSAREGFFVLSIRGQWITLLPAEKEDEEPQIVTMLARHQTSEGNKVLFDFAAESDGTHRAMHLAPALLELRNSEIVYVIDELDRSLHPLLCKYFIETFLSGIENHEGRGQLIFTTHETSLLSLDLLRRDEIWFMEKQPDGSSHSTSLADYHVRKDLKIDRGYLHGRFGAIPYPGDPSTLFCEDVD